MASLIIKRVKYEGHELLSIQDGKKGKAFRFGLKKAQKLADPKVRKAIDAFVLEQVKKAAKAAKGSTRKKKAATK